MLFTHAESSRVFALFVTSALLGALLQAQTTGPVTVDARCLDPEGRPVAGVEFGDAWGSVDATWRSGFMCPNPTRPLHLISDADGHIAGTWTLSPMGTPLLGWSRDRSLAAFVEAGFDPDTHRAQVLGPIRMVEAVRLRGTIHTTSAAVRRSTCLRTGTIAFRFALDRPEFDIALPPGRYELLVNAGLGTAAARTVVLDPGRGVVDIGPISVPLPAFDLPGEMLPDWHVDEARNVALEHTTLAHFRGKPLLVHFDFYGFPPTIDQSTRDALARLIDHPKRAAFEVVLFGPTLDRLAALPVRVPNPEFDRLFPMPKPGEPPIETMFPLLTDRTGATERLYGVSWGTALLDRDGRLVRHGSLSEVTLELERVLAATDK